MSEQNMIVTGGLDIPGYQILTVCGIVRGLVVRSPTISQGFLGGLNNLLGGRIASYRDMCETSRNDAYSEMVEHARSLGANAIIAMRYDGSDLGIRINEILCYGTAVIVKAL